MWLKTEINGLVNLIYARRIMVLEGMTLAKATYLAASFREDGEFYDEGTYVGVTLSSAAYYPDMNRLLTGIEVALKQGMKYMDITNLAEKMKVRED